MPMSRLHRCLAAGVVVVAALMLTGCGGVLDDPYKATGGADTAAAAAKLVTWPSLEETEARVQQAVVELATYVSTLVPGLQWHWNRDRSPGGCSQPYDQTEGKNVHLRNYVASGPIPDQVWPQARQRAQELAAGLGATGGQGFKDQPGDHDARFYSPEGTVLWLASTVNAAISSDTGCRLSAATKNSPASTPPTS
jgi:hypothetical protein